MQLFIHDTPEKLGEAAAENVAGHLNEAIKRKGSARLLLSTGASQFETLSCLRRADVDWQKVEMFHLDEYLGIGEDHPASFVRYLKERFIADGIPLRHAYFFNGLSDPETSIIEMTGHISKAPVDVALIGIGENGHIAFNDPPADFETQASYITVALDEACKRQQVREKWFATIDDVPGMAITMTVSRIMASRVIISAVPHIQKCEAVKNTLENEPTNAIPATVLKNHMDWTLYLDKASASALKKS
jgi:glucosamine-6-phosphate deaminase